LDTWRNNNNIDKTVTAVRIMLLALRMGWAGLGWGNGYPFFYSIFSSGSLSEIV
jgi:hypothetical protein